LGKAYTYLRCDFVSSAHWPSALLFVGETTPPLLSPLPLLRPRVQLRPPPQLKTGCSLYLLRLHILLRTQDLLRSLRTQDLLRTLRTQDLLRTLRTLRTRDLATFTRIVMDA